MTEQGFILRWRGSHVVFLELRRDSRVTTGNSGCLLCRPREVKSSIRVAKESWGFPITNSRSSLKPMSIKVVMPSSHLILCHPLLILPPIPPSITVFSNESTLRMRWPKYWNFSFSISPSNEHPRTDLLWEGLVRSPCSPRGSRESSPTP